MRDRRSGFTFVEVLVYTGVFAIVSGLMVGVLSSVTDVQNREAAKAEITQQGQFVMAAVKNAISGASLIDIANESATSTLRLRTEDPNTDPTYIYLENGVVFKKVTDAGTPEPLTNNKVNFDSLSFTKISNPPGPDTVRVDFTASYNSPSSALSSISRDFRSAISRVSAVTFDSDLLPASDNTYNVGAANPRWLNGYFSGNLDVDGLLYVGSSANDPAAANGAIYYNTTSGVFKGYAGGQWQTLTAAGGGGEITGSGTSGYLTKWTGSNTQGDSIVYDTGTNVGIGTTGPDRKLEVNSSTGGKIRLTYNDADGSAANYVDLGVNSAGVFSATSTGGFYEFYGIPWTKGSSAAYGVGNRANNNIAWYMYSQGGDLQFFDSSDKLTIKASTGYVGVGTSTPNAKLQVQDGYAKVRSSGTTDYGLILENSSGTQAILGIGDGSDASVPSAFFVQTNAGKSLVARSSGLIGVNSTAPDKQLEINSATGANLRLTYNDSDGSATNYVDFGVNSNGVLQVTSNSNSFDYSGIVRSVGAQGAFGVTRRDTSANAWGIYSQAGNLSFYDYGGTAGDRLTIETSTGKVGIGTTSPAEKLEVNGNIKLTGASPTYSVTNVVTPTASSDVATKGYVDAALPTSVVTAKIMKTTSLYNQAASVDCGSGWVISKVAFSNSSVENNAKLGAAHNFMGLNTVTYGVEEYNALGSQTYSKSAVDNYMSIIVECILTE